MEMHPEVAGRDCGHCQAFAYIEETGLVMRLEYGETGEDGLLPPVKRHPRNPPPCRVASMGCAKGAPERQRSLSDKNWRAYRHYQMCKATGQWPTGKRGKIDGIVLRNAGIIEAALQRAEIDRQWLQKKHQERLERLLALALGARAT